jgi:hypothetical protein
VWNGGNEGLEEDYKNIYIGEKAHYVLAINRTFADGFYGRQYSRAFDPEG